MSAASDDWTEWPKDNRCGAQSERWYFGISKQEANDESLLPNYSQTFKCIFAHSTSFQSSKLAFAFALPLLRIELLQHAFLAAWTMIYVRPHLHLCHKVAINHTRRQSCSSADLAAALRARLATAKQQQSASQAKCLSDGNKARSKVDNKLIFLTCEFK